MATILNRICNFFCSHSSAYQSLRAKNMKLKKDLAYYSSRAESLTFALSNAVEIPNISKFTMNKLKINPSQTINTTTYNLVKADAYYYAFSLEDWKNILTAIYEQKQKIIDVWIREISDCDDHALIMAGLVASTFSKTNLEYQGAFAIAWSNSHAYNLFITDDNQTYVYEPNGGVIQGELGETDAPYDTKMIWFMS